jgi:sugar fermentation stimulation protein A
MLFSPALEEGRLIRRYKRFLADIETVHGELLTIHCPNTGSMLNCMAEGARVWFSRSNDPKRKLPGTWEIGETPQGRLACINTARANSLIEEALRAGVIQELNGFTGLKREVAYGVENSRIDFRLDYPDQTSAWVEVKSVTLGFDGTHVAAFPDAVTQRGAKHLRELACLAPVYTAALHEAVAAGVEVLAYGATLTPEQMWVDRALPVLLESLQLNPDALIVLPAV